MNPIQGILGLLKFCLLSVSLWTSSALGQTDSKDSPKSLFELPISQQATTEEKPADTRKTTIFPKTPRNAEGRFIEDTLLAFDAIRKEVHPEQGATEVELFFEISNPTQAPITISSILPSCGCTAAKSPSLPWTLDPGAKDKLMLTVDLREKYGVLSKSVTIMSTAGRKFLSFKLHLPELSEKQKENRRSMSVRMSNIHKAMRNRQVVFQGHCRACHFDPCEGKEGEDLFQAACGICHDTPNRASMVPDLEIAPTGIERNHAYWKNWIALGKEQSLMPAFHEKHGGPLDENRIKALAAFLTIRYQKATQPFKVENP